MISLRAWLLAVAALGLCPRVVAAEPALDRDLAALRAALLRNGFKVVFQHPSVKTAYGLYVAKAKTLFISPLAFELGIGRQVLVHEAVHAAQSCPSGVPSPIGWHFSLPPAVEREVSGILYNTYRHQNKALEREAFMVQGQPGGVDLLIKALRARCGR